MLTCQRGTNIIDMCCRRKRERERVIRCKAIAGLLDQSRTFSVWLKEMTEEPFKTSRLGLGARRPPPLIGKRFQECLRAQSRCYLIVSTGNRLSTVCLKSSDNDRDQLITASGRRHERDPHEASHTVPCTSSCSTHSSQNSRSTMSKKETSVYKLPLQIYRTTVKLQYDAL